MQLLSPDEISQHMLEWMSGRRIAAPFGLVFECGSDVQRRFEEISAPPHDYEPPSGVGGFDPVLNAAFTGIPVIAPPEMAADTWNLLYLDGIFLSGKLSDGPIPLEKAFWEVRNGQKRADA